MDPNVLNSRGISLNIKDWTLDAYKRVFGKWNDMERIFKFLFLFQQHLL